MKVNRDQFLEDGYIILRNAIPLDQLDELRTAYEIMVERQKIIWARHRKPDDPPGGAWETNSQPRLLLDSIGDQIDAQTAATVEFWLHGGIQNISSELLGVEDAAVTEMMLMCSPVRDHGTANHRGWHRDFFPPNCAPLQGYVDDIIENGPRYVQWNLPLYDDDVLWVVPGSHNRFNTAEENEQLIKDPCVPLHSGVQTHLKAGDAVAYILPILHWGSMYNTKMRRTIHGGFSTFSASLDRRYLKHLCPASQKTFERWDRRSMQMMEHTVSALRGAMNKNSARYDAALENLHPGRGKYGKRQSTIFLSKAAKRIHKLKSPDFERLPEPERNDCEIVHPMTLQWGVPIADRFSVEEARILWERFKPVDDGLQADENQSAPDLQGDNTPYYLNKVPADITVENFIAGWQA